MIARNQRRHALQALATAAARRHPPEIQTVIAAYKVDPGAIGRFLRIKAISVG